MRDILATAVGFAAVCLLAGLALTSWGGLRWRRRR